MRFSKRIIPWLLIAIALTAPAALASGKFLSAEATVTDGNVRTGALAVAPIHGGLLVTFREVGVGANVAATYNVSADCTALYACINGGGNHPSASNKETVSGPVSTTATVTADASGQVFGSIPVPPIGPGDFACPPGQDLQLAAVSYTNVWIREPAHGAAVQIPGTFSLTIIDLK